MFRKILMGLSGILAISPSVNKALANSKFANTDFDSMKSSLFAEPKLIASLSLDVEHKLQALATNAEIANLQDQIFVLNSKGQLESVGTRTELEAMKTEFKRLKIMIAGSRDLVPTTET